MSFDRLVTPTKLEAQTPQHQFGGAVIGWLPAKISKIESSDDPEGLGRIRAQCDFFNANADIPNSWDGWIWVGEETTNNGKVGGSHRPIQEGSLAALLPMNGDPTQMLYLYSIHNRVDRPNPLFDRSQGISGNHTPNDVFSIKDDPNAEHTDAFPHGVTHQVTRTGDTLQQTAGGARNQLMQDGTNRVENSKSSMVLSKDGDVTQRSAGDASAKLDKDGKVTVTAERFDSMMKLHEGISEVTGPTSELSQLIKQAKSLLGGNLGQMGGMLGELNQLAAQAGITGKAGESGSGSSKGGGSDITALAHSAAKLMGKIDSGLGSALDEGISALEKIQSHGIEALGQTLMPQVTKVLASGLPEIAPTIEGLLAGGASVKVINDYLKSQNLTPLDETASGILQDLRHSTKTQTEYVLSHVSPTGYDDFKNLSGLGVLNNLGKIQDVMAKAEADQTSTQTTVPGYVQTSQEIGGSSSSSSSPSSSPGGSQSTGTTGQSTSQPGASTPETTTGSAPTTPTAPTKPDYLGDVVKLLPAELQDTVKNSNLGTLLNSNASPEEAMTHLLGSVANGLTQKATGLLKDAKPLMSAVPNLQGLLNSVVSGKGNISQLLGGLSQQIPSLSGLGDLASKPAEMVKQAIEGFTKNIEPMIKQATDMLNNLLHSVNQEIAKARLWVDKATSELRAKFDAHRVFADDKGVGAVTPHGGFNFGKDGGLISMAAPMIMKVLGKASGGLSLHPDMGAALEGFSQAGESLSKITAQGATAAIASGDHALSVTPEGVFVNDINVPVMFGALTSRIAALEALSAPTPITGG